MQKNIIIFDLDGTLAIIEERKKISTLSSGKMDWNTFFNPKNIFLDKPNASVIKIAQLLNNDGFKIVILSGRSARTKDATKLWLKKNNVPYEKLLMRPEPDHPEKWSSNLNDYSNDDFKFMPDTQLKKIMLETQFDINKIFLVFDDRDKVVRMWRSMSLPCFQVAEGAF